MVSGPGGSQLLVFDMVKNGIVFFTFCFVLQRFQAFLASQHGAGWASTSRASRYGRGGSPLPLNLLDLVEILDLLDLLDLTNPNR